MRRWLARQFQRDRRWSTLWTLVFVTYLAFSFASSHIWKFRSQMNWDAEYRINQGMLEQADRTADPIEAQRLLQDVQARTSRLGTLQLQESMEGLRLSQVRLRVTNYATAALFVAMIPVLIGGFNQKRRERWLKTGRCGECGYDLRESPERCPECGTAVAR